MSNPQNFFDDAKVGDDALCVRRGWVKINNVCIQDKYSIIAEGYGYTLEGKVEKTDAQPSLFPSDKVPQYFLDLFPRPKRKVKKTMERWVVVWSDETIGGYCASKDRAEKTAELYCGGVVVKLTGEYEVEE